VTITADPRLLARFDGKAGRWRIAGGAHRVAFGKSAGDLVLTAEVPLTARVWHVKTRPGRRTRHEETRTHTT
jgi:beta-glucosidase